MRWRTNLPAPALLLAASVVALWPALAQRAPESLLPPGFGQPDPPPSPASDKPDKPTNSDVPDMQLRPPSTPGTVPAGDVIGDVIETLSNNSTELALAPVDLPPQARRSLDRVGLVDVNDSGFAPDSYAGFDGQFLGALMHDMHAPIASRWSTILLRRALLAKSDIPSGIGGADWVADRAWLLVRMGDAENARALIARVDAENYTPKLYEAAMQAALATGDPASLCPVASAGAATSKEVSWPLAQAMCAGLSGESGTASALIDRVRDNGEANGIDVLLAEKVVGAAVNSRRSVTIQWAGVDRLTAWRYGTATATGVVIPPKLFSTAGPQVQAWQARAPLISAATRVPAVERAGALGVWSNAEMIGFFGGLWDTTDPADRGSGVSWQLREAYSAPDESARLAALRTLWTTGDLYAREVLTARAALRVGPGSGTSGEDSDRLIAALLSAGMDIPAARWGPSISTASLGWGLLAVGSPVAPSGISASAVRSVPGGEDDLRTKFLLAGLAGLGRLSASDASTLAEEYKVPVGRANSWTRAIDRAAQSGSKGAVSLLAAVGLQTGDWRYVPPEHLYHIVSALRRVGLEPEARMIAAEAVARS